MRATLKISKLGMSCFMIILSGLLLCAPAYAEESFNERTEQVEEAFVLVVKKQQQESVDTTQEFHQKEYKITDVVINEIDIDDPNDTKLFLLHQSLRLCD